MRALVLLNLFILPFLSLNAQVPAPVTNQQQLQEQRQLQERQLQEKRQLQERQNLQQRQQVNQQVQQIPQQQQFYFRADEPRVYYPRFVRDEYDRALEYRVGEPGIKNVPTEEQRAQEYHGGQMRGRESRNK